MTAEQLDREVFGQSNEHSTLEEANIRLEELIDRAKKFVMTTEDYRRQARDYVIGNFEEVTEEDRQHLEAYLDEYYGPLTKA